VAVGNDSVQADLVKVGCLELQHLVDAGTVDGISGFPDLLGRIVGAAESGANDLLAVLVEQVKGGKVSTRGDLDQLRESVADLRLRQSAQEGEVEEGVDGGVVSSESVLVVAVVDGNLDRNRGINQTDNSGGNSDEVGISAVSSACEASLREMY
jgi:hypothetical protein